MSTTPLNRHLNDQGDMCLLEKWCTIFPTGATKAYGMRRAPTQSSGFGMGTLCQPLVQLMDGDSCASDDGTAIDDGGGSGLYHEAQPDIQIQAEREMCPVDVLSHLCDEGVMAEPPPGQCAALKSSFKSSTPPSTQQLRCASIQPKKPEMGDKTRNG